MRLIYYKSDIGNFGDDLNPWLWPQLLGDIDSFNDDRDLVGIGSILDERTEDGKRKIIFGTGVRDCTYSPSNLSQLDVRFVRGPISSKVYNGAKFIADSAYCLGLLPLESYQKTQDVSYIPYFRHAHSLDWGRFEKFSGIKVILPTSHINDVIRDILSSKTILASAMHGAILADLFRVPWLRVRFIHHGTESPLTSELKWYDWHKAMGLDAVPTVHFDFTLPASQKQHRLNNFYKMARIARKLRRPSCILSKDSVLERTLAQLSDEVERLKSELRTGNAGG